MRKLGKILSAIAIGAGFMALAACSSSDIGNNSRVAWFSPSTTVHVDVDRARDTRPALTPRQ